MDYNKVYGLCHVCNKYVPRDEMISTNITVFGQGVDEKKEKLRFRLCKKCHNLQMIRWKTSENGDSIEWKNRIRMASEIRVDKELSEMCDEIDFDDQDQHAMFEASKFRRR